MQSPIKFFSPISLLIAFFGFFLPFTDINCNEQKLDTINGIELVTGYKQDFDITNSGENEKTTMERYDPNIFALNAFIAAIMGIFLFVVKKFRSGYVLQAIISAIGFICMIGLMVNLKSKLAEAQNGGNGKLNFDLNLEFEMKFGYWLVTVCFLIATIVNIILSRMKKPESLQIFPEGIQEEGHRT